MQKRRLGRLAAVRWWSLGTTILLAAVPVRGQDVEVPRTRTLPGIASPAFPYAAPEEVGLSSEMLARLGDEIAAWVANGELIGAELLIIKDGKTALHEAYGWSDREERRPMDRGSIFSIKSMTKPFVATAILMLAEEEKLSLDDPVSQHIPTYAGDERTTIRHLLSHTSGFEGLGGGINAYESFRKWVEEWAARGPTQPFGEFSYSDFNYAALGYVVEVVSGIPADTFLETRIIRPLGLDETYTAFARDAPWAVRANSRYRWNRETGDYERYWTRQERQEWDHFPAAWGLWATASDYAEFLAMWLNEGHHQGVRLLSEETVEKALAPHGLSHGGAIYGYGWFVETPEEAGVLPPAFGHGGIDGTLARAFPTDDAMVIFLTQSRNQGNFSSFENRLAMLGILEYPGPGMVWADDAGVDEVELRTDERALYVGSYRGQFPWMEDEVVIRVWEDEGRLHYWLRAIGERTGMRHHLVPLGDDSFAPGRYQGERLVAVDPHVRFRFVVEGSTAEAIEAEVSGEIQLNAHRADPHRLDADMDRVLAEREALRSRTPISRIISAALDGEGIEAARALHRDLLASRPDSVRFRESQLNRLGYRLLREDRVLEAIAVFELNIDAYPEAANAYDSLGDAYRAAGRLEEARRSYERAVQLAEKQGDENWATRVKLGRLIEQMREHTGKPH